eukprot:TRINITY_DN28759_c0_g1_i1.p2 TRINITY_DN28759_c0_g1~~TRINITY_DN28759_c0_g1_i1.p2  ORF type:complete len:131 (-),score=39.55 TRINITY_DN28759_c0_g1_i1:61-396(-)
MCIRDRYKLLRLKNCIVQLKGGVKTLYIKECIGCKIVINFVQGALFVDKAESCEIQVACHQLRIHNSVDTHFKVFVSSDAIIEHCTKMKFSKLEPLTYADEATIKLSLIHI